MPSFRSSRRVHHAPEEMFDLVADVEKYPEFVPLCTGLHLRRRAQEEDGREVLVAEMHVGYKKIRETFTSRVTLDRPALKILVEYIDGPFSQLQNVWSFVGEPAEAVDARECLVEFFITYEFRSRMLGLLMGSMFDMAFRRFAGAFEARADIVYGRKTHGAAQKA